MRQPARFSLPVHLRARLLTWCFVVVVAFDVVVVEGVVVVVDGVFLTTQLFQVSVHSAAQKQTAVAIRRRLYM